MLALQNATQGLVLAAALVPVLFAATLAIGRWLKRRHGVRLGFFYVLFCLVISVHLPLAFFGPEIFPKKEEPAVAAPPMSEADAARLKALEQQLSGLEESLKAVRQQLGKAEPPKAAEPRITRESLLRHLSALATLLGAIFIIALVRRYFWELWFERQNKVKAPQFLSQLSGLMIFIGAGLVVLSAIYEKNLTAFLFGSTVVVGIIGFAMQDLLGNVISGVALQVGKPFKIGDWLAYDGKHMEVMEINWRSTKLRDNDDIYRDIPNKNIAGSPITILTYPTRQHAIRLTVGIDHNTPPNFVKDCLVHAAAHAPGVLATPRPKAFLREFAASEIIYEIKFWMDDQSKFNDIVDAIRTNVWYETHRRKIRIPYPIRTLHIERPAPKREEALGAARNSMQKHPFLQLLSDAQAARLLSDANLQRFGRGETVIEQGERGESMFMLLAGEAAVFVNVNGERKQVATLKAGDYFGEMSLLTGEPRSATVVARVDCEMWEIEKPILAEILQQNQELVQKLGELLAKRRLETEGVLAATTDKAEMTAKKREYTEGFLAKLYSFFEL